MALGDDATPLSGLFGGDPNPRARRGRIVRKVVAAATAVVVIPLVGGTFAGAITLSSGDIEFGQGSAAANACDPLISIGINSDYSQGLSYFDVSSLTLSDLDTTDSTDVSGLGCMGKTLTLRGFDSAGTELDLNGETAGLSLVYLVGSDAGVAVSTASVATLDVPGDVDSALVAKVTVETS